MSDSELTMSDEERRFVEQCQELADLCAPLTKTPFDTAKYLDGTLAGIEKLWTDLNRRVNATLYIARHATVNSVGVNFSVLDDEVTKTQATERSEALELAAERGLTQEQVKQAADRVRSFGNQVAKLADQILQ